MIQARAAVRSDVEVLVSVVVVVADGYAHAISDTLQAGLYGHIFKRAVLFLVIQAVPVFGIGLLRHRRLRGRIGERSAVDKEHIEQAVIVVIKQRDARAHGFDQVLFRSVRGSRFEGDVACVCSVDELAGNRSGARERCGSGLDSIA